MNPDTLFVFAVTLLTFGGVIFYLVRVDALARRLEDEVRAFEAEKTPETVVEPLAKT